MGECGHADVQGAGEAVGGGVELVEFVLCSGEADLESFDLAEPALTVGFSDAGVEVVADLFQPRPLGGGGLEQGASDTCVFMNTWGIEGACAGTDRYLATLEVREERVPFVVCWGSVFLTRAHGSAAGDERAVRVDCLSGIDSLVAHRGGDVGVPTNDLGDVRWQAVEDGVGDEHPSKVVGREVQRLTAGVGQPAGR